MFDVTQKLNIALPRHWNLCTSAQLEQIAVIMREETERATSLRPFSMQSVKTALFFLWSNLVIIEPLNPRAKVEEQYYVCKHPNIDGPFHLYLWQIDYWVNGIPDYEREAKQGSVHGSSAGSVHGSSAAVPKKVKGQLDWLDDTSDFGLTNMPYTELKLRRQSDIGGVLSHVTYHLSPKRCFRGPQPLMSDFSWQQYRFAQELMDNYIKQSNVLVRMNERCTQFSDEQMQKQEQAVDLARAMFLACIFDAKVRYIDTDTQQAVHDYHYTSNQHSDNAQYFRDFPEEQWQVVLFWWSGMMRYLKHRFPHVFTNKNIKRQAASNPLEVYTATIATLEKYLKQTEYDLNRKTFVLTLETLERMARENEEMERIRRKR